MGNPYHHVCIHGHFYQPPRENPWLGVIEPQPSAAPFSDWNERIAAECYAPLTRMRLLDAEGRVEGLVNAYRDISFNIGPTLVAWLARHRPHVVERLRAGDAASAGWRGGRGGALAQAFNHPILPFCDSRDRRTQIVWGLRSFRHLYGRDAEGMWLPECAIDRDTVRVLIDHGVRFVLLAPSQAGAVRPFGEGEWQDVAGGRINTRFPYRLFDVDGAGRTHFDRYLDVLFYAPGLSLKVSFEHLLRDPERFEAEIRACLDEDAALAQIVTLATDGEIYGHHERDVDATLARFLRRTAPATGLHLVNPADYLALYPPCWEVLLDLGPDGEGSSWSCEHGVSRWIRDCGCGGENGPPGWTQAWRGPLRAAFDRLRDHVREATRREGGELFLDVWEARDDYVRVLLEPSDETRAAFLKRHAQRPLSEAEAIRAWRLLEANRYAMYMYTSCGWFFAELSGIEPVQNMRYALKAIELIQPLVETDLVETVCEVLAEAKSNHPHLGTGADVFRAQAMRSRYGPEAVAACHVLARLLGLEPVAYALGVEIEKWEEAERTAPSRSACGRVRIRNPFTGEVRVCAFYALADGAERTGAVFREEEGGTLSAVKALRKLAPKEGWRAIANEGTPLADLPVAERRRFLEALVAQTYAKHASQAEALHDAAASLVETYTGRELDPPPLLRKIAEEVLARRLEDAAGRLAARPDDAEARAAAEAVLAEALRLWTDLPKEAAGRRVEEAIEARLRAAGAAVAGTETAGDAPRATTELEAAEALLVFADEKHLPFRDRRRLADAFWDAYVARTPDAAPAEVWRRLGERFGFAPALLDDPAAGADT